MISFVVAVHGMAQEQERMTATCVVKHSDDENEEGTSISEAKTSSNGDIPRNCYTPSLSEDRNTLHIRQFVYERNEHAFDMVSIDAFKTGKKHPDVGYVLSPVIASICMFVRLLMSDDAAIVMLPEWSSADIHGGVKMLADQNGSWHLVIKMEVGTELAKAHLSRLAGQ
ncbi:hypothetical protein Tco_0367349 [Tanacetum coccineum]